MVVDKELSLYEPRPLSNTAHGVPCLARALKKVTTRQTSLQGISFQKSNTLHKATPSSSLVWWGLFQKTGVGVCP